MQNTEEEPIRSGTTAAAPVAHTRYLPSPAGATLPEKTQDFVPRLSPKTEAPCKIHAAIAMRFATPASKTQSNCITQEGQKHIETAIAVRTMQTPARTRRTHEVPSPAAATLHERAQVFVSGFPLKRSPCNMHAAIGCVSKFQISQHKLTATHEKTQTHIATAITARTTPTPARARRTHTRYLSSPAAATLNGNTRVRAPVFSPPRAPCKIHAATAMRFATPASKTLYREKHKVWCPGFVPKRSPCHPSLQSSVI